MNKTYLAKALEPVDEKSPINATFTDGHTYGCQYDAVITGVSMTYNQGHWETIIQLKEYEGKNKEAKPVDKQTLLQALTLAEDANDLSAEFISAFETSYDAVIDSVNLLFTPAGVSVVLNATEVKADKAAA